jgi:hypothetical protein
MKTVWMLGAGFSKPAGYPLVKDFLDPTYFIHRLVLEQLRSVRADRTLIRDVERWARQDQDLNRLMSRLLEGGDIEETAELNQFILRTLEMISFYHRDFYQIPYISAFAQQLGATDATVISFNYDTLVEEKLCHTFLSHELGMLGRHPENSPYNLGLPNGSCFFFDRASFADHGAGFLPHRLPTEGSLKIIKLHGSTCLWMCRMCQSLIYRIPAYRLPSEYPCPRCDAHTVQDLLFVPPASDRSSVGAHILDPLWVDAEGELLAARFLVVVGYSLPVEDQRARGLLQRIVQSNSALQVLVVDPSGSEATRERFREVCPNAFFASLGARELMGALVMARMGYRHAMKPRDSPEVSSFLSMLVDHGTVSTARPNGVLALDSDLLAILSDESSSIEDRTIAADLLGLVPCPEAREALLGIGSDEKFAPVTRGLAVRALGSIPDQAAIDAVTPFLVDIRPFEPHTSGFPGFNLPSTVAAYARQAVLSIAWSAPELDYRHPRAATIAVLESDLLIEPIAMQFRRGLRVLDDVRILLNRYDLAAAFGEKDSLRTGKRHRFRKTPREWTEDEIINLIRKRGFFDQIRNPSGTGLGHSFEAPFIKGDWVVLDHASGLMWALALPMFDRYGCGAEELRTLMKQFRSWGYAGFHDWRLPTVDEAMSLLQPPSTDGWCEDPIFLRRVDRIWTSDRIKGDGELVVWTTYGLCATTSSNEAKAFVRSVRRFQVRTLEDEAPNYQREQRSPP